MELDNEELHGPRHEYAGSHWVELSGFQASPHQSPANDYSGFNFVQAPHSLATEPPLHHMNPPTQSMQALRPLVVPPWPSTLTSQSSFTPPVLPAVPITTPISAASSHSTHSTSSPRRTLTDDDRRRMCLYHEENPTVKQTEIGAMFGVERSTVSKVLRNKEKYLFPDDGSRSPVKRSSKGRFPDIERALSNWARNSQRSGVQVTDAMIREKARFFANTVGNSDSHAKINSRSWLEKFKQKNHLVGAKSSKHALETGDAEGRPKVEASSVSQTPNGISPISPRGITSPSPLSSTRSPDGLKTDSPDSYVDLSGGYRLYNSHSATSLSSVFTDTAPSSFSAGPASPTSPFFPSDGACGPSPFLPSQQARLPPLSNNYSRPRSQTFPALGADPHYPASGVSSDNVTPKYMDQAIVTSPPLDAPASEIPPLPQREQIGGQAHRDSATGSPSSMQPPPPHSTGGVMFTLPTVPPTQEDAKRALEVVMTFFRYQPSGLVDPHEYMTIGKLMEKLRCHGQGLPGGLHQIPEQEQLAHRSSRAEQPMGVGL